MLVLLLLLLSPRAFSALLMVTNLADSGPGTLRAQMAAANPGDTIRFGLTGTIALNSELTINKNLRIEGQTFVRITAQNNSRIFNITSGEVGIFNLSLSDGRVIGTNGLPGQNGQNVYGGCIFVGANADLLMQFCVLSNNVVIGGQGGGTNQFAEAGNGGNAYGGAIGSLGVMNFAYCTLVNNQAVGGQGGLAPSGAPGSGGQAWGGGVYAQGTAFIGSAAIYSNTATAGSGGGGPGTGAGGGIYNVATMFLSYSTVASNTATGSPFDYGGGVDDFGTLTIRDCTIYGNQADYGGGLTGGDLGNTILAGNTAGSGPDAIGTLVSSDYNLIQNTNGITFTGTTTHNLLGQNPLLGRLADYGGPTLSMAPLPGSPVLDKGKSNTSSDQRLRPRPYDGNLPNAGGGNGADIGSIEINPGTILVMNTNNSGPGSLRQAILDNNALGGGNTINFSNFVAGTISLSVELTILAPVNIRGPGANVVSVSGNNNGRVFTIYDGPTQISGLTVRNGRVIGGEGQQGQNGFDAYGGGIYSQVMLTLSNCVVLSNTVVGGLGGERHLGNVGKGGRGFGGGVYNAGATLHLTNCSFIGNRASGGPGGTALSGAAGEGGNGLGGAVCTIGGTNQLQAGTLANNLAVGGAGGNASGNGTGGNGGYGFGAGLYSESVSSILSSTIHDGTALGGAGGSAGTPGVSGSGYGGGIYNLSSMALLSSTIANNVASGSSFDFGGGVYDGGTVGLTNCTIARNQADYGGGWHGFATAANCIFAGNAAGTSADFAGTLTSLDYNLIQATAGLSLTGATNHVVIGQDPLLGSLQKNGGLTPTISLLPGSPAIDQGHSFGLVTDQRGFVRSHDLPAIPNVGGGDGSDIGALEFLPAPLLNIRRAGGNNTLLYWPAEAADYRLESTTLLSSSPTWTEVIAPRVNTNNFIYVTNSTTGNARFYRLALTLSPLTP